MKKLTKEEIIQIVTKELYQTEISLPSNCTCETCTCLREIAEEIFKEREEKKQTNILTSALRIIRAWPKHKQNILNFALKNITGKLRRLDV